MRFIKKYFIIILLFISSISVGILALVTALRLREFRTATPAKTSALTPPCSLTFTIEDDTPRKTSELPTMTKAPSLTTTPTPTQPLSTPTPTPTPQSAAPTASPTKSLIAQGVTSTPTPIKSGLTPTIIKPSPTSTPTQSESTKTIEPELPVSGINLPTWGAFLLGVILLAASTLLFPSGK